MKTQIVALILLLLIVFAGQPAIWACGPFSVDPIFSFTKHGYYPLSEYISNLPGVVPESYGRISLVPFYRQLTNSPLNSDETTQVDLAIKHRIGGHVADGDEPDPSERLEAGAVDIWLKARNELLGGSVSIDTNKQLADSYSYFTNCLSDSFMTATKTLNARIAKYGKSADVQDWLTGQDAVFSNCNQNAQLPVKAGQDAPKWLNADREYQISAALFYQSKFPEARAGFDAIAADKASPWNKTARFVAARSLIRESGINETSDATPEQLSLRKSLLSQARDRLNSILIDNSMNEFHESAHGLLGFVEFKLDPIERQRKLASALVSKNNNKNIYNDLTDYIWLLDQTEAEAARVGMEREQKLAQQTGASFEEYHLKLIDLPTGINADDLTDWLFSYQASDSYSHAFERWKSTNSLHWFVIAIDHANFDSPNLSELLDRAEKVESNYLGYDTVKFNQARLLLASGNREKARQVLDAVASNGAKKRSVSSQNRFFGLRTSASTNISEFVKYSQRYAAAFAWSDDANEAGTDLEGQPKTKVWQNRTMFDQDGASFINYHVPISVLRQIGNSANIPVYLQEPVISAAWVRAVVLNDKANELPLAKELAPLAPELAPSFTKYLNAKNETDREAYRLLTLLNYPALSTNIVSGVPRDMSNAKEIDSIAGNWWCTDQADPYASLPNHLPTPDFLSPADKGAVNLELTALRKGGNAPSYLTRRSIAFANANPQNPLSPELLYLAVRSTRYGCGDKQTGSLSKQAYDILHTRYRNSNWAKQTPYWYKGR